MSYKIDLHVHSYMSDGTLSPKEIVQLAAEKDVKAIALTDHDCIDGIKEAAESASQLNIDFLNGIEVSVIYENGRKLHILGLGIDINNSEFLKVYNKMRIARENSIPFILKVVEKQGIKIDINDLKKHTHNKYLDRYDVHEYFTRNRLCNNSQKIWDKYLDPIPYEKDELLTIEEAIDIIKKAGGLSFLAHYNKTIGLYGFSNNEIEFRIKYMIDMGLNGVERYYPSYIRQDIKFLDYIINKYNLNFSGGTDFHGKNRPGIGLGTGSNNNLFIPYKVYQNIICKTSNLI